MEEAFGALNIFLGSRDWFDGPEHERSGKANMPGELDAIVFAYTQVILAVLDERRHDFSVGPGARRLVDAVRSQAGIVRHRDRILSQYYH